ncbi:MAG: helix-turn-helix domain-containing protein [Pseudomonadota bacterium]
MLDVAGGDLDCLDIKFLGLLLRHKRYLAMSPGKSLIVTASGDVVCAAPRFQANAAARAGLITEFREGNGWAIYRASEQGRSYWYSWRQERERLLSEIRKLKQDLEDALLAQPEALAGAGPEVELYPGLTKSQSRIVGLLKRRAPNVCSIDALVSLCPRSTNADRLIKVHILGIRKARPDLEIETVVGVGYRLVSGDPDGPQS